MILSDLHGDTGCFLAFSLNMSAYSITYELPSPFYFPKPEYPCVVYVLDAPSITNFWNHFSINDSLPNSHRSAAFVFMWHIPDLSTAACEIAFCFVRQKVILSRPNGESTSGEPSLFWKAVLRHVGVCISKFAVHMSDFPLIDFVASQPP